MMRHVAVFFELIFIIFLSLKEVRKISLCFLKIAENTPGKLIPMCLCCLPVATIDTKRHNSRLLRRSLAL